MRKFMNIFAAALVVLAAVSCEKNEVLPDSTEGKVVTLSATIDNGGTKTSLDGWDDVNREYPVLWSKGDKIAVIQDDVNCDNNQSVYTFTLSTGDNTTSATFTCDEAGDFDPNYEYRAVYPASAVVVGSDGKFEKYSFSDTQIYAPNSFGVDAMPMETNMCKGANYVLKFTKNVFGVLKLQLKSAADEKVTSIVITSSNALNGEAQLVDGAIVLRGEAAENKKVTLDCSTNGGVTLNQDKSTDFHIALPAGATGLKVLINTNKGSYYKEVPRQDASSNPINAITAGNILKMPELNTKNMAPAYIENGVYLGDGVAIPLEKDSEGNPTKYLIWAPVNCGYDAVKFKYGKLYQWGRKDGQGYWESETSTNNDLGGGPEIKNGPISEDGPITWENYVAGNYSNAFFKVADGNPGDWVSPQNPDLWGNGTKTVYDPCPDGWRVPTNDELIGLTKNFKYSGNGYWCSGSNTSDVSYPRILLQYNMGYHEYNADNGTKRNDTRAYYWSSTTDGANSKCVLIARDLYYPFDEMFVGKYSRSRANAYTVRCVKDMPQSQPMPGSN